MRNEKWKAKSKKQRAKGSCEWVKPGKAVYKLQMERTRRSHMTANAICEAHLHSRRRMGCCAAELNYKLTSCRLLAAVPRGVCVICIRAHSMEANYKLSCANAT